MDNTRLESLEEMEGIFRIYNLPILNEEKEGKPNKIISRKEIQSLPKNKSPVQIRILPNFKTYKVQRHSTAQQYSRIEDQFNT